MSKPIYYSAYLIKPVMFITPNKKQSVTLFVDHPIMVDPLTHKAIYKAYLIDLKRTDYLLVN